MLQSLRAVRVSRRLTAAVALALTGCQGELAAPIPPIFGTDPAGARGVDYAYAALWRPIDGLRSVAGFYDRCGVGADRAAVFAYAARAPHTSPDANCLLLGDADRDGDLVDDAPTGYAFHEHATFFQFWHDDNWLARYMARAYDRPEPAGLHDRGEVMRWRVLEGDNTNWLPSGGQAADQLALDGIYLLNAGLLERAFLKWHAIERVEIRETYHLALWLILSARLHTTTGNPDVMARAQALRARILQLQETSGGWRTGIGDERTLVNIETTALCVLALGAK